MRRSALALLPLLAACAYYNGLYNAREAEKRADAAARAGRETEASALFGTVAEKAETVLARYPRTRWRADALYLAGRGAALGGRCESGLPRLEEFLSAAPAGSGREHRERAERARLSAAICHVRERRPSEALRALEPLLAAPRSPLRRDASLWAARAATALGDHEAAARHLSALGEGEAQWELLSASLRAGALARAESLLADRARAGDYRDAVSAAVRDLWAAGRVAGADSAVARFGVSRAPANARARLHLELGELALSEGRSALARPHLGAARRLTSDTLVERRSEALLSTLALREAATIDGAARVLARSGAGQGTEAHQRLSDVVMLVRLLSTRPDPTGASLFLAAEVARDSLGAPELARALFARLPETYPDSPVAPKALLAATVVAPESAAVYRRRVLEQYRVSPYARLVAGDGAGTTSTSASADDDVLLRSTWAAAVAAWSDSLRRLRPQPGGQAAATTTPRPTPPGVP